MQKKFLSIVIILLVLSLVPPRGYRQLIRRGVLPPLVPCEVTVTQDGVTITEASVVLLNKDLSSRVKIASGITDSTGTAKLQTRNRRGIAFDGIPAGQYTVMIVKIRKEGKNRLYNRVDAKYASAASTDLEMEVVAGNPNQFRFDVGKPAHNLLPDDH